MWGATVELVRFVDTGETDAMGEPIKVRQVEQIENVLWHQSAGDGGTLDEMTRENSTIDTVTIHLPKTYTKSVAGCSFVICGQEYAVQGDPLGYMAENTPGAWNRTAFAKRVDG